VASAQLSERAVRPTERPFVAQTPQTYALRVWVHMQSSSLRDGIAVGWREKTVAGSIDPHTANVA
jgi:hypothetical protein